VCTWTSLLNMEIYILLGVSVILYQVLDFLRNQSWCWKSKDSDDFECLCDSNKVFSVSLQIEDPEKFESKK
jgi:hypothetical protein